MNSGNTPLTILVADDEALARKRIIKFLEESGEAIEILESSTGKETLATLLNHKPALVFLDIQMTDMTGFDVLKEIPESAIPIIIFVTAFDNFAVKAFEVQAIDFLLKPYKKQRFMEALNRGLHQIKQQRQQEFQSQIKSLMQVFNNEQSLGINYLDQIVLKLNKKYFFVSVDSINYISASSYYAEIFTLDNNKYVYRISMNDFMEKLNPNNFIRINRSTIINLKQIKEVISEGAGEYSVVLQDRNAFAITKNYKKQFLESTGIRK